MKRPSEPSTSAPVSVPYEQGPTGLCLSCHQIKSLVSTHNNSPFNSSSSITMTSKKKRPAPPQRQDVIVRWKNYFGAGDLEDWQRLCQDLGLDGEFGSKTKCRTVCICPSILLDPSAAGFILCFFSCFVFSCYGFGRFSSFIEAALL